MSRVRPKAVSNVFLLVRDIATELKLLEISNDLDEKANEPENGSEVIHIRKWDTVVLTVEQNNRQLD